MENLLVGLIIGLAVIFMVRKFYKSVKNGNSCGCGCESCDTAVACDDPAKADSN
jgi:hypothetical protein